MRTIANLVSARSRVSRTIAKKFTATDNREITQRDFTKIIITRERVMEKFDRTIASGDRLFAGRSAELSSPLHSATLISRYRAFVVSSIGGSPRW